MEIKPPIPCRRKRPFAMVLACAMIGLALHGRADSQPQATSASSSRLVPEVAGGYRLDSPEFARLYGPGVFTMNMLANTVVGVRGGHQSIVSLRFLSLIEGSPSSIRLVFPAGKNYSRGHGGVIRISLHADDGSDRHLPDMKASPLASTIYRPGLSTDLSKHFKYPLLNLENRTQPIHKGRLYHLVFENVTSAPDDDFISIDNAATRAENGRPARWLNTLDWATLFGTRPYPADKDAPYRWTDLTGQGSRGNLFSPIMQITLTNGQSQGVSDMESGGVDPQRVYTATRDRPIRERFTPGSNKRVSGFSVATATATGGKLQWRIMRGNTRLASGVIDQPTRNYSQIRSTSVHMLASSSWYDVALPETVTLRAGQAHDLEFVPVGQSIWKFADQQNGLASGFTWPAAFSESQAQHLHDKKWINTFHWDYSRPGNGSNWPVVLHLAL